MLYKTVDLSTAFPGLPRGEKPVTLTAYCRDNSPDLYPRRRYPALVVFPGGSYSRVSDREAEPVALHFLAQGFQVFVLRYSIAPSGFPTQLVQAAAAVAFVRKNAQQFLVDPNQVAVMGFSAGGHLAASMGTLFGEPAIGQAIGVAPPQCRPDAMVLCYPVITAGEKAHEDSISNLLGGRQDPSLLQKVSLEKNVTGQTPPAFIWHTCADSVVPVENALCFAAALQENGVPFELHLFENGPHGLSLATVHSQREGRPDYLQPAVARWAEMAAAWLKGRLA